MPKLASLVVADHAEGGGLYPGGKGTAKFRFIMWDYAGKQAPDSNCTLHMEFTPTDGSNNGNVVNHYYSVGDTKDFIPEPPDGNRVMIQDNSQKTAMHKSCLASMLLAKLQDQGLDLKQLETAKGLSILDGTVLTVTEQEQPKREGLEEKPAVPGQRVFKKTWLVPVKAEFPWEKKGGKATAAKPTVAASGGAAPATQATAQVDGDLTLESVLLAALTNAGGAIPRADIPKALLDVMTPMGVPGPTRLPIMKAAKDWDGAIKNAADLNAWTMDGDVLSMV